jgi:hypothetical protein
MASPLGDRHEHPVKAFLAFPISAFFKLTAAISMAMTVEDMIRRDEAAERLHYLFPETSPKKQSKWNHDSSQPSARDSEIGKLLHPRVQTLKLT